MAQKNKTETKARTAKAPAGKKVVAKSIKKAAPKKAVAGAVAAKVSKSKKPETKAVKPVKVAAPARKPVAAEKPKAAVKPAIATKPVKPVTAKPAAAAVKPVALKPAAKTAAKPAATKATPAKPQRAVAAAVAAPAAEKITAPAPAAKPQEKKVAGQRHGFKLNEHVVYPAHGVGRIVGIEEQEIAGHSLELFVITFEKEKLTLRVPTGKLDTVGMRKLAEGDTVKKAMDTLKGRARVKRTMWSRRAQEYVAKINSGSLISIAEVVRDLYRSEAQPEQSYSERQLYEDALDRMAREIAAVEKLDERGAVQRITDVLSKSAKGRRAAAEAAEEEEAEAA